jgi:hypothetical protein
VESTWRTAGPVRCTAGATTPADDAEALAAPAAVPTANEYSTGPVVTVSPPASVPEASNVSV